jgi:hypothetical protein
MQNIPTTVAVQPYIQAYTPTLTGSQNFVPIPLQLPDLASSLLTVITELEPPMCRKWSLGWGFRGLHSTTAMSTFTISRLRQQRSGTD